MDKQDYKIQRLCEIAFPSISIQGIIYQKILSLILSSQKISQMWNGII